MVCTQPHSLPHCCWPGVGKGAARKGLSVSHPEQSHGVPSCWLWLGQGKGTPGGVGDFSAPQGDSDPSRNPYPRGTEKEKERSAGVSLQREGATQILQHITRSSKHQKHLVLHTPPAMSSLRFTAAPAQPHPKAYTAQGGDAALVDVWGVKGCEVPPGGSRQPLPEYLVAAVSAPLPLTAVQVTDADFLAVNRNGRGSELLPMIPEQQDLPQSLSESGRNKGCGSPYMGWGLNSSAKMMQDTAGFGAGVHGGCRGHRDDAKV